MTTCFRSVPFLLRRATQPGSAASWVNWDWKKDPHYLLIGASSSGKSKAAHLLLAKTAVYVPDSRMWIAEYKPSDSLRYLRDLEGARYYCYTAALDGLRDFYAVMQARMNGDPDRRAVVLLVDELAGLLLNLDRTEAKEVESMVSSILMLGRELSVELAVGIQRPDSSFLTSGSRDNFANVLALGNVKKEAAAMVGLDKESILPVTSIGGGHLMIGGGTPIPVQVPLIRREDKLKAVLADAVTR